MRVWRLGRKPHPCEYIPHKYCHWNHRFDDPKHEYRTLYCAAEQITCLREVLADLRPNAKERAELNRLFPGQNELQPRAVVMPKWRKAHVLAEADIHITQGNIVDIDNVGVRQMLEEEFAELLEKYHL